MDGKYQPTGQPLTDYEKEVLTILMEECAEVVQAASKLLRFGKENRPPERDVPNTVTLAYEMGEVGYVHNLAVDCGLIRVEDVVAGHDRKRDRLAYFMQTRYSR